MLTEQWLAMTFLHTDGFTQVAVFTQSHSDIFRDGNRRTVNRLLHNLPGRPVVRGIVSKEGQTDLPTAFNKFLIVYLIIQRSDVALFIQRNLIRGILYCRLCNGWSRLLLISGETDIINRISRSRHSSFYQQVYLPVFIRQDLRSYFFPFRIVCADTPGKFGSFNRNFHYIRYRKTQRIVEYNRDSLDTSIQFLGNRPDRSSQYTGELLQWKKFVIPWKFVCTRNTGTSKVIVELMEDKTLPWLCQTFTRITRRAQPIRRNSSPFGSIAQQFILPVVEFHGSLWSIAPCSMHIHQKFTVEYGQFGMFVIRQIILKQLVACSTDNLQRPVSFDTFLHRADRTQSRGTSRITRTVIAIYGIQRSAFSQFLQFFIFRQVDVFPTLTIIITVGKHNGGTVYSLP